MNHRTLLLLLSCIALTNSYADGNDITINNNVAAPAPAAPADNNNNNNGCNNDSASTEGMRPGTYYQTNPHGGTDTIYTTGDKTPYNLNDAGGCNNNNNTTAPIIQPYIGINPGQRPGPRTGIGGVGGAGGAAGVGGAEGVGQVGGVGNPRIGR